MTENTQAMTVTEEQAPEIKREERPQLELLARLLSGQTAPDEVEIGRWPTLFRVAVNHRVITSLTAVIRNAELELPEGLENRVRGYEYKQKMQAMKLDDVVVQARDALDKAGIPTLWLKGIALSHTVYDSAWMRMMVDVDVLVPRDQRQQALDTLVSAGFLLSDAHVGNKLQSEFVTNHYQLYGGVQKSVLCELHYDLIKPRLGPLSDEQLDWFWSQSEIVDTEIGELRILKTEAMLLHLAIHDIFAHDMLDISQDSHERMRLQRKLDVHRLLLASTPDWALLTAKAQELDWVTPLIYSLEDVRYYFNTPVPQDVLDELRAIQSGKKGKPVQLESTSEVRVMDFWQRFRMMPFSVKMRYMRTAILPPREKMRFVYNLPEAEPAWWDYPPVALTALHCADSSDLQIVSLSLDTINEPPTCGGSFHL